jgi:hypothetical protein
MIEVLLIWFLMTGLASVWGLQWLHWLRPEGYRDSRPDPWTAFWTGFFGLSVLLGWLVFFTPLSPLVKLILWPALLSPLIFSKPIRTQCRSWAIQGLGILQSPAGILAWLGIGIALWKCLGPPEIFDEGAYHLPLVRMWESQGIVKGMANLNGHYGLNSTWHILTAFSNPTFIPGWQEEMALNGLLAVVLSLFAASRLRKVLAGSSLMAHWMAVFFPFFVFRNLLSSPSTDIPAIICTWFVFNRWLEILENKEDPFENWTLFSLVPVWIAVLKTSSAALFLIPLFFTGLAVLSGHWSLLKRQLLVPVLLVFPWLLQNWLLTGYLVFPIKITRFGNPDWQVPFSSIDKKFYLEQFRDFAPPAEYNLAWLKHWFSAHNADTRIILLLSLVSLLAAGFVLIFQSNRRNLISLFLYFSLLAGLLSWFVTITEPRYGFGSLVFAALVPVAWGLVRISGWQKAFRFLALVILPMQAFNLLKTVREVPFQSSWLLLPTPAPQVAEGKLQCGNFEANLPLRYTSKVPAGKPVFCWDCTFPCVPPEAAVDSSHIFQRSSDPGAGYRYVENP